MKGLSKSRCTAFCQCPKALWLKVFKPKEAEVNEALQASYVLQYNPALFACCRQKAGC